jgi:hypothetical protein
MVGGTFDAKDVTKSILNVVFQASSIEPCHFSVQSVGCRYHLNELVSPIL